MITAYIQGGMKVKRIISILALTLMSTVSYSNQGLDALSIHQALLPSLTTGIINWKVGQSLDHNITVMGMEGTMHTQVASETDKGFWLNTDIAISGMNQKVETHISKEDGTVIEIRINGEKSEPQPPPEMEVQEMKEAKITVPAGAFDCTYAKLKDLKTQDISEVWMNQKQIPINGMLKLKAAQRGTEIVAELTKFKM